MIRTVLGDIHASALGRTDYHEHAFQVSPLLLGDELDDEVRSRDELSQLRDSNFSCVIDATPIGLGRRPLALARISADCGLGIVATTGAHHEAHYGDGHWMPGLTERQLTERFTADLVTGMPEHDDVSAVAAAITPDERPVRAGMLKAGITYWRISPFERRVLSAVASAHRATGSPVMIHLEFGSAAVEVLDLLRGEGVASEAVVLAHIDRNPDAGLHAELAATGAYLGYDGFARPKSRPDSAVIECLVRASELGALDRVLLGGDVARRTRYIAYGGMPGLRYLGERVVTRLLTEGHEQIVTAALIDNPARLLNRF